jgi:hypothetical protein
VFEPRNACQEFEKVLGGRGLNGHALGLVDGCDALFDFYKDIRAGGHVFEQHEDADMLLFQWGTYDWGQGEHFSFNLIRQLICCEQAEDEDIWQLSLVFEFEVNDELRALGSGTKWCQSLSDLPQFREYVYRSAAFTICIQNQIRRTVLDYARAG